MIAVTVLALGQKLSAAPNLYKIGITERPIEQRLSELNATVSSSIICLWESLPCVNAQQLETELHNFFKDKQVKSEVNAALTEWFRLDEFDLRELQGILKMNFRNLVPASRAATIGEDTLLWTLRKLL